MYKILIHSGIKGQKWGVRRYQNQDGTWTMLGKMRRRKEAENTGSGGKYDRFQEVYRHTRQDHETEDGYHLKEGDRITAVRSAESMGWEIQNGDDPRSISFYKNLGKDNPHEDINVSFHDADIDLERILSAGKLGKGIHDPGYMNHGERTRYFELEARLKKDIITPSKLEQEKIFDNIMKNKELKKKFDKFKKDEEVEARLEDLSIFSYESGGSDKITPYQEFLDTMLFSSNPISKPFRNELKKRGYNGFLKNDESGRTTAPLVIMDMMDKIGDVKIRELYKRDAVEAADRLLKEIGERRR